MPSKLSTATKLICLFALLPSVVCGTAMAQDSASSLETQLGTIFKVTRVDNINRVVLDMGSVVTVAKSNLLFKTPLSQPVVCSATVKETTDQVASSMCRLTMKGTGGYLQAGQRLLVTKIKATISKDTVTVELTEAPPPSATSETGHPSFKTAVNFVFSNGYLSKADPGQVADMISKSLPLENGGAPPAQQGVAQQSAAAEAPAAGQVELGMTEEQVKSILGQPTSQRQGAARAKVFIYSKQVTFQNGVVTAIQ